MGVQELGRIQGWLCKSWADTEVGVQELGRIQGCAGDELRQLGAQKMMQIVQDVTTTEFSRRMGKKLVLSCP